MEILEGLEGVGFLDCESPWSRIPAITRREIVVLFLLSRVLGSVVLVVGLLGEWLWVLVLSVLLLSLCCVTLLFERTLGDRGRGWGSTRVLELAPDSDVRRRALFKTFELCGFRLGIGVLRVGAEAA